MKNKAPIRHIGVLTSGGDSPGMNAAVRAIVRTAVQQNVRVTGIIGGYSGLTSGRYMPLGARDVSNIIQRGGTILRTARCEEFRTTEGRAKAAHNIKDQGMDAFVGHWRRRLICGAKMLFRGTWNAILGLPERSITTYSARIIRSVSIRRNTAVEAIDKIRDTLLAMIGLFFIEVMGRKVDSLPSMCSIAAGQIRTDPERPQGSSELVLALEEGAKTKSLQYRLLQRETKKVVHSICQKS